MVLHGEQGQLPVAHALDGAVIQVEVRNLEPGRARDAVRVANYREAMVLSGDEYLVAAQIAHRMVATPVAVRQLGRRAAEGQTDELMSEADAEGGEPAAGQIAHAGQRILHRGGIARAVGQKESVGVESTDLRR